MAVGNLLIPLDKQYNTLYTWILFSIVMSSVNDLRIRQKDQTPKLAIALLAVIAIISVYIVGYDQGQLFSLVQGNQAYDAMWIHEFTHDIRHAAGFPCH